MQVAPFRDRVAQRDGGGIIIIARLARQSKKNLLGGFQFELSECGIILGMEAMAKLYFMCKWHHFVVAMCALRRNELPFFLHMA